MIKFIARLISIKNFVGDFNEIFVIHSIERNLQKKIFNWKMNENLEERSIWQVSPKQRGRH